MTHSLEKVQTEKPHTELTLRNFSTYAFLVFAIGVVTVGFGLVDLVMVGPFGEIHVAAVGQGDLIVATIFAGLAGAVDIFTSKLAAAEGAEENQQIPNNPTLLFFGFLGCAFLFGFLGWLLSFVIFDGLSLLHQVGDLIQPTSDYVIFRLYGVVPFLIYMATSEALKIYGKRAKAFTILIIGFILNAAGNALFLYSPLSIWFDSPEGAVAFVTVFAHCIMAIIAFIDFWRHTPHENRPPPLQFSAEIWSNFVTIFSASIGVGMRHLNDYASAIIPVLLVGTLNVSVVAALAVATKIYTLFCRVPQALFAASFIYYSYGLSRHQQNEFQQITRAIVRRLLKYCSLPTLILLILTFVISTEITRWAGGPMIDNIMAQQFLITYLAFIPFYIIEQFYAELLTAHHRARFLFIASSAATYLLTIPFAYLSIIHWQSALWALIFKGFSTVILAFFYFRKYQTQN